jgi:fructokinase
MQALEARFGGSPANVAVGLARLGLATAFLGRLSVHGFGPWLREHLEREGVDLAYSISAGEAPSLAVVALDHSGIANYTFYGPDTADWKWSPEELPDPGGIGAAVVHTGSLATLLEPGASVLRSWVKEVRRHGRATVSVDPNVRPTLVDEVESYRAQLDSLVSDAHLVKVSAEDLAFFDPDGDVLETAARWLSATTPLVVVTSGEGGATALHHRAGSIHVPAPRIVVADTIGAGDAFSAGLLAALDERDALRPGDIARISSTDLKEVLALAVEVAAMTCTRPGADPPTRDELNRLTSGD